MEAEDEAGVNGSMAKISSRMGRERGISGYHFLQMAFLSFYERNHPLKKPEREPDEQEGTM